VIPLQVAVLVLVGLAGTCVVLTRDLLRLAIVNSLYGLTLTVLFLLLQAPDVALSMIVVGSVASPVVLLAAIAKVRERNGGGGGG
jgi:energy-converting hydrogenase B subunit D